MPGIESARKEQLIKNFDGVTDRIRLACEKTGRPASSVDVLAVVKYAETADVKCLIETGKIRFAGESRAPQAAGKWSAGGELSGLKNGVKLHFIGHLQSNKARTAAELFDYVDSIDGVGTARELNRHAERLGKTIPVLIQINPAGVGTQSGTDLKTAGELLAELKKFRNLSPAGYMAIAPIAEEPESLRPVFKAVKEIFDRDFPEPVNKSGFKNYLSLGMSADFETAVQEGSNLPRIGTLIFKTQRMEEQ